MSIQDSQERQLLITLENIKRLTPVSRAWTLSRMENL